MNSTAQTNMIKQQLRTNSVLDEKLLSIIESTPREQFVPEAFRDFAFADMQIPISATERMMTPSEEGVLLQSLQLQGHETVLEIGTGSGYLTALLSRLCKKVISIDIVPHFIENAALKLQTLGYHNVELYCGNAFEGWPSLAPYDCMIFTGGIPSFSNTHQVQLQAKGKVVAIIGSAPAMQAHLYTLHNQTWKMDFLFNTCLPELTPPHVVNSFIF